MKKFFTLFLIFLSFTTFSQIINDVIFLQTHTKENLSAEYGVPAQYDVNLYRINYNTKDVDGTMTTASGLLCVPDSDQFWWPQLSYSHGTVSSRYEVPSYLSGEEVLPTILSSIGFVTTSADYLGLGDSPGVHPYVHADSEASAELDMLRAAREYCTLNNIALDYNQLFISGYSQGGHAGAALHRLVEQEHSDEFNVVAASHMSGPYDVSSSQTSFTLSDEEYFFVAYIANISLGYQRVYGNIFPNDDIYQFFKEPYADEIIRFKNEEIDLFQLNTILINLLEQNEGASTPKSMLLPEILDGITNDFDHPVNVALRDNDVYEWSPKALTRLVYCEADDQVSYLNSITAENKMIELGATNVLAVNVNPNFDHGQCVSPAVTYTLTLFLFNVVLTDIEEGQIIDASIIPNPADSYISILSENALDGNLQLIDMTGKLMKLFIIENSKSATIQIGDVDNGIYIIRYIGNDGTSFTQKVVIK